ncbi:MAG TPA: hypothetical protein VIY47_12450, partial [Ignavibacteriaceae bacterium]
MADTTTIITGVADGAFETAFDGLPEWATQDTLEVIEGILKNLLKTQNISLAQQMKSASAKGQGLDPKEIEKLNDEVQDLVKSFKAASDEEPNRKKRANDLKKEEEEELKRKKKQAAKDLLFDKVTGALIGAGTKLLEVQKQYFITSDALFKSGVNMLAGQDATASSMTVLQGMVDKTGLKLEILQEVVQKYSSSINAISITKFGSTLKSTNARLIELGYSSEQQAELLGTMVETESSYADIRS